MKDSEAATFARRLALLREGRAVEAASLSAPPRARANAKNSKGGGGEEDDGEWGISLGSDDSETSGSDASDMEENGDAKKGSKKAKAKAKEDKKSTAPGTPPPPSPPLPSSRSSPSSLSSPPTSLCIEAARDLEAELFRRQPASVCANCGCHNPGIKRDGVSKLFVARLLPQREAQNAAAGVTVLPAVPAPGKEGREGEGEAAASHEALALEQALTAATASANGAASAPSPSKLLSERQDLTGAAAAGLRLMTPAEAREVARRLWSANEEVLRELYAKNAPGGVFLASSSSSPSGKGRASSAASAALALRWRESYRSFFVSTVAVPPNRLRPPSKLGDATFEHPHNIALAAVVSSSADVANAAAPKRVGGGDDTDGNSLTSPPDLAAGLRAWLALQSALNSLIDSSAPDARRANAGAAGVRQALEKKEVSRLFLREKTPKKTKKEQKNSLEFFRL